MGKGSKRVAVSAEAELDNARPGANKQKVLVISTRAINARARHLMEDFRGLLPHSKKDSKIENKDGVGIANDMCETSGCNKLVLFEVKRREDLFIHMSCAPAGPSIKFLALNVHTMLELNFSGNHLKGSRPIVTFDASFDASGEAHWTLMKEMLTQIFATPKLYKRSKPFIDHIITFSRLDDSVWMRNYQIAHAEDGVGEPELIEVGPRVTLQPIQIFEGSLRGATLWKNSKFVAPHVERREILKEKEDAMVASKKKTRMRQKEMRRWSIPESQVDQVLHAGEVELEDLEMLDIV